MVLVKITNGEALLMRGRGGKGAWSHHIKRKVACGDNSKGETSMCEKTEDKQCLKDEFSLVFNKVRQQKDQNWIIKFHICTLVEGREWISPAFFFSNTEVQLWNCKWIKETQSYRRMCQGEGYAVRVCAFCVRECVCCKSVCFSQ